MDVQGVWWHLNKGSLGPTILCSNVFTWSCAFDCNVIRTWNWRLVLVILLLIGGIELNPGPLEICRYICKCFGIGIHDQDEERTPLLQHGSRHSCTSSIQEDWIEYEIIWNIPQQTMEHPELQNSLYENTNTRLVPPSRKNSCNVDNKEAGSSWWDTEEFRTKQNLLFQEQQLYPSETEGAGQAGIISSQYQQTMYSTSEPLNQKFTKVKGFATMSGQLYEVKVAALLFARGINEDQCFRLASNMEAGVSFDDIVFSLEKKTMFLQLKHRNTPDKKITNLQLVLPNGDFSLFKYYKSYVKIKKQWKQNVDLQYCGRFEDSVFVIYTNAIFSHRMGCNPRNLSWQSLLNTGGNVLRINEKSEIFELIEIVFRYKQLIFEISDHECTTKQRQIVDTTRKLWVRYTNLSDKELNVLVKELHSFGDTGISDFREFLSRMWVFTGQASEQELDSLIQQEIKTALQSNETVKLFNALLSEMKTWWKTSDSFLEQSALLWQRLLLSHINSISKPILERIEKLNITFTQDVLCSIEAVLQSSSSILNIVTDGSHGGTILSCLKVHQTLGNVNHLLVSGNMLQTRQNEVLKLWGRWCKVLVVVADENTPANFLYQLRQFSHRKLVYISQCEIKCHAYTFRDNPKLKELDKASQNRVLSAPVIFQGYEVLMGTILNDQLQDEISADIIVQVLQGTKFTLSYALSEHFNFIPRILQCKNCVKLDILLTETLPTANEQAVSISECVIFALSGLSLSKLKTMMPLSRNVYTFKEWNSSNCDTHKQQSKQLFIVIEDEDEFDILAESCINIPLHWLHYKKYLFTWKQSRGDISLIQKYQHHDICLFDNIKTAMDLPQRVVIVSAEPGMGKTTHLNYLAIQTKKKDPKNWVIVVNLNNFTQELNNLPANLKLEHVFDFLLETGGFKADFRYLFNYKLANMENIYILFDGYDEISPLHADKVSLMLTHLQKTKLKKMWITTRPVMKKRLEKQLSTVAFTLQPLSEMQQQQFITEIWSKNVQGISKCLMNEFSLKLLQLLAENLSDNEKQFTGIPLQAMLLAHAFESHLSSSRNEGQIWIPERLDILQIFDKFIGTKLSIYCDRGINKTNAAASKVIERLKRKCYQNHMHLALVTLLSPEDFQNFHDSENILKCVNNFIREFEEGYDHIGIIKETSNGKPIFVHRTFADYFAAWWFSINYTFTRDLMRTRLLDPNFQVLRHFLSRILAKNFDLHTAVANDDISSVLRLLSNAETNVNIRDAGGRTALHIAVSNYIDENKDNLNYGVTDEIMEVLLNNEADPNIEDEILQWRPLRLAEEIKAWSAVNLLLQKKADNRDLILTKKNISNYEYIQEILRISSRNGYVKIIQFLLDCGIHVGYSIILLNSKGENTVTMLHEAARYGQLKLVQFLVQHKANIDARDGQDGRTPLMWAAWHGEMQTVDLLITLGAETDIRDKYGFTAKLLASQKIGETTHNDNILHYSAAAGEYEVVEYLLNNGLDINCINKQQQTALWCAAWGDRRNVIQFLQSRGADLHIQDITWGWTPLHVAARWGYLQTVQYLEEHGARLSLQDNKGHTPLDIAVQMGHVKVAEYLRSSYKRHLEK